MFLYCHSGSSCCMTISSLMCQDYADISWRMKESIDFLLPLEYYALVHLMAPDCTLDYPGSQWCPARNLGGIPEDIIHCLIKSMIRHRKACIHVCGSHRVVLKFLQNDLAWNIFFVSLSFLARLWIHPFAGWTFSSNDTTSFCSQHITQYLHRNDFFPSLKFDRCVLKYSFNLLDQFTIYSI